MREKWYYYSYNYSSIFTGINKITQGIINVIDENIDQIHYKVWGKFYSYTTKKEYKVYGQEKTLDKKVFYNKSYLLKKIKSYDELAKLLLLFEEYQC